jgi:TldD protein
MNKIDHESAIKMLAAYGDFNEIYEEKTKIYIIENDNGRIEKCIQVQDSGASLRTFCGNDIYFTAANYLDEKELASRHKKLLARKSASFSDSLLQEKIITKDFNFETPYSDFLSTTSLAYERLRKELPALLNTRISFHRHEKSFTVSNSFSQKTSAEAKGERLSILLTLGAGNDKLSIFESVGFSFKSISSEEVEQLVVQCMNRARVMERAKPGPAGIFPCVLSADAGGTLIHEAVGHGLEADLVDKNVSVYGGKLGHRVASELITVTDDGTYKNGWGSFLCDDEGAAAQKTVLIENGILRCYLYDLFYALKHKTASTGNGRRQNYVHKPYPRMSNTFIEPGTESSSELISALDKGILVKKMGGGQVNTLTGDFIFQVMEGYFVEKGEIIYPIKNCSLIGNGPQILNEIEGVASDFGTSLGTCGKEGQGVPVGDGQPTIRMPRITVGGTAV